MKALEVACAFVAYHGPEVRPTNLKLNKLVYFAQVESLRRRGAALFDDVIEAWKYGPVEPAVYHAFKSCGSGVIVEPPFVPEVSQEDRKLIADVASTYGRMTAFDLVSLSHRDGGAWSLVYGSASDNEITPHDIAISSDMRGFGSSDKVMEDAIEEAIRVMPNALRMLENS